MGVKKNIDFETYPVQGNNLHKRVSVCYKYDTKNRHIGTCIRDDIQEPFETIFFLDNGRVIKASECQWHPL